jgi:hypothetical protein
MGFFDNLKNQLSSQLKREASKAVNDAAKNASQAIAKGRNHSESFSFDSLPTNLAELKALPEASLDSAFKTVALCIAVLCNYEKDVNATWEMLDFLKGPESVNEKEKTFIKDRLSGKQYKTLSFFKGATPENGYAPSVPYSITVSENPYSFDEENWATLYVTSGGADAPRPVKLRRKPSTNQWFINDIQCLADIRIPTQQDAWA